MSELRNDVKAGMPDEFYQDYLNQTPQEREMGEHKRLLETPTLGVGENRWDGAELDSLALLDERPHPDTVPEGALLTAQMYKGTDYEVSVYRFQNEEDKTMMHCESPYLGTFNYDPTQFGIGYKEVPSEVGNMESPKTQIPVFTYIGDASQKDPWEKEADSFIPPWNVLVGEEPRSYEPTEQVQIPQGVKNLDYTFEGNKDLQYIPGIPNSVESMHGTFKDCPELKDASKEFVSGNHWNIPEGVKDMSYAFAGCSKLTAHGFTMDCMTEDRAKNLNQLEGMFTDCPNAFEHLDRSRGVNDFLGIMTGMPGINWVFENDNPLLDPDFQDTVHAGRQDSMADRMMRDAEEWQKAYPDVVPPEPVAPDSSAMAPRERPREAVPGTASHEGGIVGRTPADLQWQADHEADGYADVRGVQDVNQSNLSAFIGASLSPALSFNMATGPEAEDVHDTTAGLAGEFADVNVFTAAGNNPELARTEAKRMTAEALSRNSIIFDTQASLGEASPDDMRYYYMTMLHASEGYSAGALDTIESTDEFTHSEQFKQRGDAAVAADWADKARAGVAEINCGYTSAVMDSLHEMDSKYHFMRTEDWMEVSQMEIYGVDTSSLVYYQPGQDLQPVTENAYGNALGMSSEELDALYAKPDAPVDWNTMHPEDEIRKKEQVLQDTYHETKPSSKVLLRDPGQAQPTEEANVNSPIAKVVAPMADGLSALWNKANQLVHEGAENLKDGAKNLVQDVKNGAETMLDRMVPKTQEMENSTHEQRVKQAEELSSGVTAEEADDKFFGK